MAVNRFLIHQPTSIQNREVVQFGCIVFMFATLDLGNYLFIEKDYIFIRRSYLNFISTGLWTLKIHQCPRQVAFQRSLA